MSGEVGSTDQLLNYIIWFNNVVELYQRKELQLLWVWQCRSPGERMLKRPGKTTRKIGSNLKGGWQKGRLDLSKVGGCSIGYPGQSSLYIKMSQKASFLNPDPLMHWSGPENITQVKIDDEGNWTVLDNGSTINAVTPQFIKALSLDMGPVSDLVEGTLKINGFYGIIFLTLGLCYQKGSSRRGEWL